MLNLFWGVHWHISKAREYPGIHDILKGLRKESYLTPIEWQKILKQRLRKLLIHAGKHVPYYRKIFKDVGFNPLSDNIINEMGRIPILTKALIREHIDNLVVENIELSKLRKNATGGSTGVPLTFYQDQRYQTIARALNYYVMGWWGILPYDRTAIVWGADRDFHDLSFKERFYHWRQRTKSLNAFRMSDENLLEFCHSIKKWKPAYLKGYSSALEAIALCAQQHGINNITFKSIRSTAETLYPHQRDLIETTFKSPVYDFYGSREVNNLAAECPEEKSLHLTSAWRLVEIVDENGCKVPDGDSGYIIVTDLSNFSMPFIRYRNEDMGRMASVPCHCSRPTPVLEELLGRSTDMIRTARGDIIHGEYFTHLFYGNSDIKQFQIHQTSLDRIVLRYVPIQKPADEFIHEVANKIRARLGEKVKVDIEVCDDIPVPPSGKHRFTISDVNTEV